MKYQLGLLNRVITGDLSPEQIGTEHLNACIDFLQKRFDAYTIHYKLYFKETSGRYELQSFQEYTFTQLYGLPQLDKNLADNNVEQLNVFIEEALRHIPVTKNEIQLAYLKKAPKEWQLEITAQREFIQLRPEEAKFHYFQTLLFDETTRIIKALTYQTFQFTSQKHIRLYIRNHQLALEKFAQVVVEKLDIQEQKQLYSISKEYTLADVYKSIFIHIQSIQQHIERNFTKYLDLHGLVPYQSCLLSSIEINNKLQFIYPFLLESNIDSKLVKIINKPLQRLAGIAQDERITYRTLLYHKSLLQELFASLQENSSALINEKLTEILYRLNYNSIDFFDYITSDIEKAVAEKETHQEKKELLYYFQKIYRQSPIKTNSIYQHSLLPIRMQILTWIKEEIYYLEKIALQSEDIETKETSTGNENKISTRLSVAQLAYFFRVMYEVGMISVKSQWDIFRFLQDSFSSKKRGTISTQSLNNKYYNVEDSTKRAIKNVLIQMLNYINKSK